MSARTSRSFERQAAPAPALPAAPAIGADRHAHVCEGCAEIWWHSRTVDRDLQPGAYEAAHRCPKCGSGPYLWAYDSLRAALEVRRLLRAHL